MAAVVARAPASTPGLSSACTVSSDEASVITDQVSSTDCSEGRAARLAVVQEVLHQIFEYYSAPSSTSESRVLTSARFNKLLLDSSVIEERLSNAKADLVFAKVCGHASNPMNSEQFLDAVVQLAKQKHPQLSRAQGILKLYNGHFATFRASAEEPVGGLAPEVVEVMSEARSGLQALYRIYFQDCIGNKSAGQLPANFSSLVQDAWVQFLTDYEVLPEFAQKPMVFAAFREVSQLKALPQRTRQQILSEDGQDIGRVFTYVHFALALVALARRCFAEFCASSLVRLFQWMDDSKGHVLASSKGSVSSSGLRILGHGGLAAELQLSHFRAAEREAGIRRSTSRTRGSAAGGRQSLSVGALRKSIGGLRSSQSSASGGPPPSEWKGRSGPESPSTILARAAQLTEALGGAAGSGLAAGASAQVEAIIHEIFAHYSAQGDLHNQSHMSLMNFRHFLRDCGLVSSEGSRSDFPEFVPAERVQQARKSLGGGATPLAASASASSLPAALRRASSTGSSAKHGGRGFVTPGRQQAGASPSAQSSSERSPPTRRSAAAPPKDLPLRVYQQPPLTAVDADLIFVQAIQGVEAPTSQRELAKRRLGSFSQPSAGTGGSERPGQRTRMTVSAFSLAIQTLSIAIFRGGDEEAELQDIMEEFSTEVLEPLSKILLGGLHQEVQQAAEMLAADEDSFFSRSKAGLERIFTHYARTTQKTPQPHWTSEEVSKFVRDFGLAAELSQRPVQQIFRSCVGHERFDLKEMSLVAFQWALVVMAQRIHPTFKYSPVDKVVMLFHRLNTASREEGHLGPKPPSSGTLIPGLPPLAALGAQDARPSSASRAPAAAAAGAARRQDASAGTAAGGGARARASSASGTAGAVAAARRQAGRRPQMPDSWACVLEDVDALDP